MSTPLFAFIGVTELNVGVLIKTLSSIGHNVAVYVALFCTSILECC